MKKIIISRTDSIGDVILTLPMAGVLKKHFPGCTICFLGRSYTRPVIEACEHVDEFLDWDEINKSSQVPVPGSQSEVSSWQTEVSDRHILPHEKIVITRKAKQPQSAASIDHLKAIKADAIIHVFPVKEICLAAKKAGIPLRIGTSHRWYTFLDCNRIIHFSRKNSELHEVQLNLKLLEPLGIKQDFSLKDIPDYYGLSKLPTSLLNHLTTSPPHHLTTFNLILHAKSKGSGREWGLENYSRLIELLPAEKFRIFITGTEEEALLMKDFLSQHKNRITDLTGKLTLSELVSLISNCDGIVAASTGPLHIAAALGKHAIGLYAPMRPIHPKRWAPLGINADYLVLDKECNDCRRSKNCECIRSIKPEDVAEKLFNLSSKHFNHKRENLTYITIKH